jgi:3-hydroxyacyl-CoA dehydrogenase/enoyl-CoA hydratase/3-hydroxybutyryl-CoA epimerase
MPAAQNSPSDSSSPSAVRLETDASGKIVTLWLDLPGKKVNTLSAQMWAELDRAVDEMERTSAARAGVIVASAKPRSFVAGADLLEMRAMDDAQLEIYLQRGQQILNRLAELPIPTVAAINGDALGGGFELALACKRRIAVDDPSIKIGLPETTLGLVPGWGGTIRLPRLIGIAEALKLMLPGKAVSPQVALKLGMVNRIVPREELIDWWKTIVFDAALEKVSVSIGTVSFAAGASAEPSGPAGPPPHVEDQEPSHRAKIFEKFRAETRARSGEHLPAPLRLIDIVELSYDKGIEAASDAERRGLIELRNSPAGQNLMRLFFLRTRAKKAAGQQTGGTAREIKSAAVIGGGTMGAGIAHALLRAGIEVDVLELDERSADAAARRIRTLLDDDVQKGRLDLATADKSLRQSVVGSDWSALADADFVIEAIVEDLDTKRGVFRRITEHAKPDTILASNTSSLSIAELTAAIKRPERVVGLHFFNPVPKMPLVEVVRAPQSSADALATAVALTSKLGKTPVVVKDSPGFLVNRVLFPQLHAALALAGEGVLIDPVDRAIKAWGMPMGPFTLMDEIGLDVMLLIFDSLTRHFADRFAPPAALRSAVEKKWLGRKLGRGFYVYPSEKGASPTVNAELAEMLSTARTEMPAELIQSRVMEPMAAEAQDVLREGVVDSPDALDLASVLGLGFPAFRGGLATYAELR